MSRRAEFSADAALDYIQKNSIPEPNSGCWIWMKYTDSFGYGDCNFLGKHIRAHVLSAIAFGMSVPHRHHVCHKCENPGCVNPDHLFVGTSHDNQVHRTLHSRLPPRKNHRQVGDLCKHGHLLSGDNVYVSRDLQKSGWVVTSIVCRTCARESSRRWKAARKERKNAAHIL